MPLAHSLLHNATIKMTNILKVFAGENADSYLQKQVWGYSCKDLCIDELSLFSGVLDNELLRGKYGKSCICPENKEKLESKVRVLSENIKFDNTSYKDDSKKDFFDVAHPDCIILSHYQKWCRQFVCDLEIAVSLYNKKDDCDLTLLTFISKEKVCDISLDEISVLAEKVCKLDVETTLETQGCEMAAQVYLVKNYCNITNNFTVSKKQCEIAHSEFITKHSCNIDVSAFKQATKSFNNC